MSFTIAELSRRLRNVVTIGKVVQVGSDGRVKVAVNGLDTTWLKCGAPSFGEVRECNIPVMGEQVVVLSPDGDLARGVVVCSIDQNDYPLPTTDLKKHRTQYSDGAVIEYDRATHKLVAQLPASGTADIDAPGGIVVHTAGDLALGASGDINFNAGGHIKLTATRIDLN